MIVKELYNFFLRDVKRILKHMQLFTSKR